MASPAEWMREALRLAEENVAAGGGPFAALVACDGELVAAGVNRVVPDGDPTAHAEVVAIRAACRRLGTFDLSGVGLSQLALLRTRVERRLQALSSFLGHQPAQETRWPEVGKRDMSTPISATTTCRRRAAQAPAG